MSTDFEARYPWVQIQDPALISYEKLRTYQASVVYNRNDNNLIRIL